MRHRTCVMAHANGGTHNDAAVISPGSLLSHLIFEYLRSQTSQADHSSGDEYSLSLVYRARPPVIAR